MLFGARGAIHRFAIGPLPGPWFLAVSSASRAVRRFVREIVDFYHVYVSLSLHSRENTWTITFARVTVVGSKLVRSPNSKIARQVTRLLPCARSHR